MNNQKLLSLLREMLKNSKKSDREIARRLGVSQATVSRTRARLEKEGYVKAYTVIPDFTKLGYEILAFTFAKLKAYSAPEEAAKIAQNVMEWAAKHPNIIFVAEGSGLGGKDGIIISFHKDYSRYTDFMRNFALDWGHFVGSFENFIVSLDSRYKMKPLDLKYLADDK